jgi:hypothetical protein
MSSASRAQVGSLGAARNDGSSPEKGHSKHSNTAEKFAVAENTSVMLPDIVTVTVFTSATTS